MIKTSAQEAYYKFVKSAKRQPDEGSSVPTAAIGAVSPLLASLYAGGKAPTGSGLATGVPVAVGGGLGSAGGLTGGVIAGAALGRLIGKSHPAEELGSVIGAPLGYMLGGGLGSYGGHRWALGDRGE
jgi:hypothetical protein